MPEFLTDLKRTHDCGALRASDAGKRVVLFGWVSARRDHGGCVFIDLRDRAGVTQVVFEPHVDAGAHGKPASSAPSSASASAASSPSAAGTRTRTCRPATSR